MARIVGPDPKAVKMRRHAFHLHQSGSTTLSASAVLLPPGALAEPPPLLGRICASHGHAGGVALTAASLVEAFLVAEQRDSPTEELQPRLIPEARLGVLVEPEESGNIRHGDSGAPQWLSAELLAMVENDAVSSLEYNRKNFYAESVDPSTIAKSATRIAVLGVSALASSNAGHMNVPLMPQRGDSLLVVGSPFGILSPFHFFNSISVGAVANCLPPGAVRSSLLMADIHCLPGMEGAPVFDKNACFVGMLMKPLRQRGSNIQVQLVITWDGICTAWSRNKLEQIEQASDELLDDKSADSKTMESCGMDNHRRFVSNSANDLNQYSIPPSLREAISSVVLVTVGDTTWASGILLNKNGLVLTNAHLLEPWRFGRTSPLGLQHTTTSLTGEYLHEGETKLLQSQHCKMSSEDAVKHEVSLFNLGSKREKRIAVRLDDWEKQTWCSASVVFISKGPLDVALLQMEKVAIEFCAIRPEFVCPTAGSSVYVVGHGLLGPRSGLSSSLSSGVVSKVVQIPSAQPSYLPSNVQTDNMYLPVMLQTTAAVHPGASGGVIVNSYGRMVGLITSNAKHGGGSTIPRLNFSIPCKSLEMVFKYAANGDYTILEQLDKPNELLSSVWALAQAPSSLPFLSSPPGKSREGKVSEFSKFLANQKEGLTSRSDLEAFLRHKTPSKI